MLFDILSSVGKRQISMLLALLDFIAAFYTVDHSILFNPVVHLVRAHGCKRSFIVGRTQTASLLYCVSVWRCAVRRSFWCGSGLGARPSFLRPLYSRYSNFRDWSYRSGSAFMCMRTRHIFTARVSRQMPLYLAARAMDVINSVKVDLDVVKSDTTKRRYYPVHLTGHQPLPWKTRYAGRQVHPAVERRREQSCSLLALETPHGSSCERITISSLLLSPASVSNRVSIVH